MWEVIRSLRHAPGRGMQRIERLAEEFDLPAGRIQLATDFYSAFPSESGARIEADNEAADRVRHLISRRERLLSP